ncbi:MAG: AAA family ATPase [Anaerolineales bacterium]|nr:AAA family ATPase [Anaerolineales bacterium]
MMKPILCPKLIGRASDLEVIRHGLEQVRSGQGQTVLLSGEAGIGKSRLVVEVKKIAADLGFTLWQGSCFEPDRTLPYAPILDLLRTLLAAQPESLHPYAADLVSLLPELTRLWPGLPPAPSGEPEQEKRRLFQILTRLCTDLGSPLLLVIEDLHWGDDASLEFLRHLARRITARPILLLLTYRSDESPTHPALQHCLAVLERERLVSELLLPRLKPVEVETMIRTIFEQSQPVRADFVEAIHTLSDGNPFFVEEILKALVSAGDIYLEQGSWTRRPLAELRLPRTVQDTVQRRTAQLSDAARSVLTLAAVAGQRFDFTLLAEVTKHSEAALISLIRELVEAQLVSEEAADHFVFRHALTRKAIYDQLLARERRPLHRLIADSLERLHAASPERVVADLAYHFYAAGAWEKALIYSQQAGERAQRLHAPRAAVEHYSRALEAAEALTPGPLTGGKGELYHARGQAYDLLGEFTAARDDYVQAVELAHAQANLAAEWQSLLDLGFLHSGRDYSQAHLYLQRALALARDMADPLTLGHTLNRLGNWHLMAGNPDEGSRYHHEALAIFQTSNDKRSLAVTLDLLGTMNILTADNLAGARYYEQAIPLLREVADHWTLSSALAMHACTGGHFICEAVVNRPVPLTECIREGEEAITLARQIAAPPAEAFACVQYTIAMGVRGEFERAVRAGQTALSIASEQGSAQFVAGATRGLGCLCLAFLDYDRAKQWFELGLPSAQETGSSLLLGAVGGGLAETLMALGRLDQAQMTLEALPLHDASLRQIGERTAWTVRAELLLAQTETEQALTLIDKLVTAAPHVAEGGVIPKLWLLRAECLSALGRPDEAQALLLAASRTAREGGFWPILWRIELALGKLYHRQQQIKQAQAHYHLAQEVIAVLAHKVSDETVRTQFEQRAMALIPSFQSPSPSQAAKASYSGLTAREREVAALLAQGLANKAIADKLVLSERTVEKHVENVMGKLGFTSRAQVAVWAAEKGLK